MTDCIDPIPNHDGAHGNLLPWVTPRLDHLGGMDDVKGNGAQPPNDASASPTVAAS